MPELVKNSNLFDSFDAPPVLRLIHDAGNEGEHIRGALVQHGQIIDGDLGNGADGIAARAELRCVGNGIAHVQRVELPEMVVDAAVMPRDGAIPVPRACVGKMPRAFEQRRAVRSLIDLDR